ncbi:MAG: hypothetical protein ACM3JG_16990 [Thiohalocapsa sp.]
MHRAILAGLFAGVFFVALLPVAARAELPMSPVFRDGPGGMPQPPAPAAAAATPAHAAKTEAAKSPPAPASGTTERGHRGEHPSAVVATAPIPPPLVTAPEPEAKPQPPPKTAAARHHRPRRHYAHRRYAPAYQPAAGWFGGWAASRAAQLGPNPYSPNGGD